jgi:MADS-box transcription factor
MGKNKIDTTMSIGDERKRQVTYYKRRKGLFKKAIELAKLCSVNVFLGIVDKKGNFSFFCSGNIMKQHLEKYLKNEAKIKDSYTIDDVHI